VPLVWLFGYFEFIGLISFGIAYITAFIGNPLPWPLALSLSLSPSDV
jgi:hypothetical protein